ncbi:Chaperone surA [Gossypium australe]|uniref:Chaperone surA n=1 Tax=Gossypium australe TaxID=47621 RepID=A0A5B6W8B6_9ROSI|nr:Chaperone surA [Gossypium australe]
MSDGSREATSEEMKSHMLTQEQATSNSNMGNLGNEFMNVFFTMMTQLFDQFIGNNQEPQPQPEVVRLTHPAPLVPTMDSLKVDSVREIWKRGAYEFLGDKGDDPIVVEQWLSHFCRVIKELKCTSEDSLRCVISLLEGEAYQWWETLFS